ncbi:MAG: hypothetical protein PHY12_15890 [Eubacteriales bacterium]|nr:hypothetical protein [Eubacteriales bacterium]
MQKKVKEVRKPILRGSWHGRDAWKMGGKTCLNLLAVTFLYLVLGLMLSFNSLFGRIAMGVILVGLAVLYLYNSGVNLGQADAAFGEILYQRQQDGKPITQKDHDRSFHPAKGWFAALIGVAPYFLIALVFAFCAQRQYYTVGALPSWMSSALRQNEVGDALAYYSANAGLTPMAVLRIVVRAMTLPFMNVGVYLGDEATLLFERLAPLWVLVAPCGFGAGYMQGENIRARINTGIVIGDKQKKRRERKERKRRAEAQARTPERLI